MVVSKVATIVPQNANIKIVPKFLKNGFVGTDTALSKTIGGSKINKKNYS